MKIQMLLAALCLAVVACQNEPTTDSPDGIRDMASIQGQPCTIAEADAPLTPGQHAEMVRVRQKVFGTELVDPSTGALPVDKVVFSWVAVTTYAASLNGNVVLFDAFIGDSSGYVPLNDCELTDLRAEAVFMGHGHNDHARLLATVANRNRGVNIYASEEVCIDLALALNGINEPHCTAVIAAGAPLGAQAKITEVFPDIDLAVLRLTHSAATQPQNPADPSIILPVPIYPKPVDAGPCFGAQEGNYPQNGVTCPPLESPHSVAFSYTQDGSIALLYQFQMANDLNITWFNSIGPAVDEDPVLQAMSLLPQTDIQFGAILGLNGVGNGFLDVRKGTEALRSRLSIPGHHDFLPKVRAKTFELAYFQENDKTPESMRPGIIYMSDPEHYLAPERLTWDSNDPLWAESTPIGGLPLSIPRS